MKRYLFVYGLMKRGKDGKMSYLLDLHKAQYVGEGFVDGMDLYRAGRVPFVVDGVGRVHGELYVVDDHLLKTVDTYEGVHRGAYERVTVQAQNTTLNAPIPAEVYRWMQRIPQAAQCVKEGKFV